MPNKSRQQATSHYLCSKINPMLVKFAQAAAEGFCRKQTPRVPTAACSYH